MSDQTGRDAHPEQTGVLYFPVSPGKLIVMSIVTFGWYEVLWFYQHWRIYKVRTRAHVTPAARSLFAPFFCYSLFRKIRDTADAYGVDRVFSPGLLAVVFVALSFSGLLPHPFALISFAGPFLLAPVQVMVNEVNRKAAPGHDPNDRFTRWNIVGIVAGGLLLLSGLVGSLPSG
jgi:hypothetical protein